MLLREHAEATYQFIDREMPTRCIQAKLKDRGNITQHTHDRGRLG